jgi:hypothetical protein
MNSHLETIGCVHCGWFEPAAYAVDLIAMVVLLYLIIRNAAVLSPRRIMTAKQAQIEFRLLVSKRVTQILGLFCAFQFCQFLAYAMFILAMPDSKNPVLVDVMVYSYRPITFTFGVLALGIVQYAVLDATLRRRAMKDGAKEQDQPPEN